MLQPSSLPPEFDRGVVTTVHQGDCLVSGDKDVTYSTVLGSCVSACIRDVVANVGGMNHFLLAEQSGTARDRYGASARYGAFAMEQLINKVLTRGTGKKSNLEIKVFGGGNVTESNIAVGTDNAQFVLRYLEAERLRCVAQDLGGRFPRRIHYSPATGRAVRRLLGRDASSAVARDELEHATRLSSRALGGEIELFE